MRPALVVIDAALLRARRYWPKPGGGFVTDDAVIEEQRADFSAALEQFRQDGGRERKISVPMR